MLPVVKHGFGFVFLSGRQLGGSCWRIGFSRVGIASFFSGFVGNVMVDFICRLLFYFVAVGHRVVGRPQSGLSSGFT